MTEEVKEEAARAVSVERAKVVAARVGGRRAAVARARAAVARAAAARVRAARVKAEAARARAARVKRVVAVIYRRRWSLEALRERHSEALREVFREALCKRHSERYSERGTLREVLREIHSETQSERCHRQHPRRHPLPPPHCRVEAVATAPLPAPQPPPPSTPPPPPQPERQWKAFSNSIEHFIEHDQEVVAHRAPPPIAPPPCAPPLLRESARINRDKAGLRRQRPHGTMASPPDVAAAEQFCPQCAQWPLVHSKDRACSDVRRWRRRPRGGALFGCTPSRRAHARSAQSPRHFGRRDFTRSSV